MRPSLVSICESFLQNREIIRSVFSWDSSYIYPVCAAIFTDKRQMADADTLLRCRSLLKEGTGIFSNFRGTAKTATISMLAVSSDPAEKLDHALQAYALLKERFFTSQYLPVVSMIIADLAEPARFHEIVDRTRRIYELMKSEHPFLTSAEDSVFAALLALSDSSEEQIVAETERCYQRLKPEFFSKDAVQSLSQVLALGDGTAQEKCDRTLALYRSLKDQGRKYGTSYELATLGVLALLPEESGDTVADDIIEADAYLKGKKGYGFLGLDKRQRLMHAGMLVTSDRIGDQGNLMMGSAAIGATISLIVAQQVAIYAAIAASSAASSSASSGGN